MKILVVDDEPAVWDSLRRALQLEGYDVELAADGQEAADRLSGDVKPFALDGLLARLRALLRRLRPQEGDVLRFADVELDLSIFERVWGYDFGLGSNSLDVCVGYLRRKTEQDDKAR